MRLLGDSIRDGRIDCQNFLIEMTIEEYFGFLSDISNIISFLSIFSLIWEYNSGIC